MRQIECSLLIITAVVAITSCPARAQQDQTSGTSNTQIAQISSPGTVDLIGAGVSLINNLFNPPSRQTQIQADADVKKAQIAADAEIVKEKLRLQAAKDSDRVTPILDKWGVKRTNCSPNVAIVSGITADTVCVEPTNAMPAGYYTYNSSKQQLVRTSDAQATTTRTTISSENNGNTQRISNEQSVRVNSSTNRRSLSGGF